MKTAKDLLTLVRAVRRRQQKAEGVPVSSLDTLKAYYREHKAVLDRSVNITPSVRRAVLTPAGFSKFIFQPPRDIPPSYVLGIFASPEARSLLGEVLICYTCRQLGRDCRCTLCSLCGVLDYTHTCGHATCACTCFSCTICSTVQPASVRCHRHHACASHCSHGQPWDLSSWSTRPHVSLSMSRQRWPTTPAWPRSLGFEIETAACAGRPSLVQEVLHALGWVAVPDGSLPEGGAELRSCPIQGKAVEEHITRVIRVLLEQKVTTTKACGLHIHVDARDLSSRQIVRTHIAWSQIEAAVFKKLAKDRIGNQFCHATFPGWQRVDPKLYLEGIGSLQGNGAETAPGMLARNGEVEFRHPHSKTARSTLLAGERYRSLNFQAYRRHGTLEFRLFSPRLDVDYILKCARIATAVLEFGRYGLFTELPKYGEKKFTVSSNTRLTFSKLERWYADLIEKRIKGEELIPVANWKKGQAE